MKPEKIAAVRYIDTNNNWSLQLSLLFMVKTVQGTKVNVFQVLAAIFDVILNMKGFKQQHASDMLMIVIFRGNKCIFPLIWG